MADAIVIGDVRPRVRYVADGMQGVYIYPFVIFTANDLDVYLDENLQNAGYQVSGVGQNGGGSLTFNAIPATGVIITIQRRLVIERTSDFAEGGAFRASVINQELDRLTAVQQQLEDDLERSFRLPPFDSDVNMILPDQDTRRGGVLAFDETGAPVIGAGVTDIANAEANAQTAIAARDAALAAQAAGEAAAAAAVTFDPALYRLNADPIQTADMADGAITQAKIDPAVMLGGPSLGVNSIIRTNAAVIAEDITIPAGVNGMSAGPITIADGFTLTVNGNYVVV